MRNNLEFGAENCRKDQYVHSVLKVTGFFCNVPSVKSDILVDCKRAIVVTMENFIVVVVGFLHCKLTVISCFCFVT